MPGKGGRPRGSGVKHGNQYKPTAKIESAQEPVSTPTDTKPKDLDTEAIRSAIHEMLDGNLTNLAGWLKDIGQQNPEKALNLFMSFSEFIVPKQQRVDNKQTNANPVSITFMDSDTAQEQIKKGKITIEKPNVSIDDFI